MPIKLDKQDLLELLYEIQIYLDDRSDITDEGGPNDAMSLEGRVSNFIKIIEES